MLAACSSGADQAVTAPTAATSTSTATSTATSTTAAAARPEIADDPATTEQLAAIDDGASCDALDTRSCLLPYPSNFFTTADAATDTGLRVAFPAGGMPANAGGTNVDPSEWNRNDGFSPNSSLLTYVADLDATGSSLPSWTDPAAAASPASPVVMVDTETGDLLSLWAEPDAGATDDSERLLVIHPAAPLTEGHHYVVALQGLVDTTGALVEPSATFRALRDRLAGPDWLEARRATMEKTLATLASAGIDRGRLQLAWDFTVASTRSITERATSIRDAALTIVGNASPAFTIEASEPWPDGQGTTVTGSITVPSYLSGDGGPGTGFFYGEDGLTNVDELPQQNGSIAAPFTCLVPNGNEPAHLSLFGHGLFGSRDEVRLAPILDFSATEHAVLCGTDWIGMSGNDFVAVFGALQDLSNFPALTDRLQQSMTNAVLLGRALLAEDGLSTDPAFAGTTFDRSGGLDFLGVSQGSILGLALTALSPDIDRAALSVPGVNFSLVMPRWSGFSRLAQFFEPAYPDDLERMLMISLMQQLFDRGEGGGYVNELQGKAVLLQAALGDQQVSLLSALAEARAVGAKYVAPFAAPGRLRTDTITDGLDPVETFPYDGSAIVLFDSGSKDMPLEQLPPTEGHDPHLDPIADADARRQIAAFLFDDQLIDVCGGAACTADPIAF